MTSRVRAWRAAPGTRGPTRELQSWYSVVDLRGPHRSSVWPLLTRGVACWSVQPPRSSCGGNREYVRDHVAGRVFSPREGEALVVMSRHARALVALVLCGLCVLFFLDRGRGHAVEANTPFGFDNVVDQARKLASQPFKPPPAIPDFLAQATYDQYRDIRFDPALSLWKDGDGPFQVQFIHPGFVYRHGVAVNTYDRSGVRQIPFSPTLFNYGRNGFADKIPADLGFAGFQIAYPLYKKSEYNHVLVFAGASYFRGVAKHQVFGLSARGLALDTGLPSGEEFPSFKEFWLERPSADATSLKVLALLDSPRISGAYEFVLRVSARTQVDVRATLFERKRATELGIAPLTSMFFYGEERPRPAGEWRPEIHDSDGLLIHSGTGEWIWRPLVNPERLLV